MYYDVISVQYIDGYKLRLTFENGRSGIVDFKKYIGKGGVFSKLKDPAYFRNYQINNELGVITWDNEIDIAPETLYSEATKTPLPDWMQANSELKETA